VLLEEADELYSSMIHVRIRLKSDSFAFPIMPLSFIAILETSGVVMGVYPPLAPHPTYEQPEFSRQVTGFVSSPGFRHHVT
jgi:hypothetical protein